MEFLRAYGDQLALVLVLGFSVLLVCLPVLCRMALAAPSTEAPHRRGPAYSPPAARPASSLASTRVSKDELDSAPAPARLPRRAPPAP
jgi:hypothetical protein